MKVTATASAPSSQEFARAGNDLVWIELRMHRTIGKHPLAYLDASLPRDHRFELPPQSPGLRPIATTHFEHVTETFGRDHAGLAALAFEKRIGTDRRAMNDGADLRQVARALAHAVQKPLRFTASRRRYLADPRTSARFIEKEEIGERSTDIDANNQLARHAAPSAAFVT